MLALALAVSSVFAAACVQMPDGGEGSDGGILDNIFGEKETTDPSASEEYPEHSQMLVNVIKNEEYKALISRAKNDESLLESPLFDPHPYAFLESEGHNVEKIKSGATTAFSMAYVLNEEPNNLYIHTRVLVDDYYYHSYLLKYTLTIKEMIDYKMMHSKVGDDATHQIQCVFLNNEISKLKQPEIVGESKIEKITFEVNWGQLKKSSPYGKKNNVEAETFITEVNKENNSFTLIQTPFFYPRTAVAQKCGIRTTTWGYPIQMDNGVWLNMPSAPQTTSLGYNDNTCIVYSTQNNLLRYVLSNVYTLESETETDN